MRDNSGSWHNTMWPSRVVRKSVSRCSKPKEMASSNALTVFSVAFLVYPRWLIQVVMSAPVWTITYVSEADSCTHHAKRANKKGSLREHRFDKQKGLPTGALCSIKQGGGRHCLPYQN